MRGEYKVGSFKPQYTRNNYLAILVNLIIVILKTSSVLFDPEIQADIQLGMNFKNKNFHDLQITNVALSK